MKWLVMILLLTPINAYPQNLGYTTGAATLASLQEYIDGCNPFDPISCRAYYYPYINNVNLERPKVHYRNPFKPIYLQNQINRNGKLNFKINHGALIR